MVGGDVAANIVSPRRHRKCTSGLNLVSDAQDESGHIEDSYYLLCVSDLPAPHHPHRLRQRPRHYLDELVGLAGVCAGRQVRCPVQMDALISEPGRRPYSSKTLQPAGGHTDLLLQLSAGAVLGLLSGVEPARGDLEEGAPGGVAVLLDEKHGG